LILLVTVVMGVQKTHVSNLISKDWRFFGRHRGENEHHGHAGHGKHGNNEAASHSHDRRHSGIYHHRRQHNTLDTREDAKGHQRGFNGIEDRRAPAHSKGAAEGKHANKGNAPVEHHTTHAPSHHYASTEHHAIHHKVAETHHKTGHHA
jgi:hypothetical protein